jgi:asparagine synthase (glutamine-hydrolysing)
MGGLEFILYKDFNLSIDFIKAFNNMKSRGPNETTINTYSTNNISNLNTRELNQVYSNLTRNDIATYIQWNFALYYHRLIINDTTFNASQPFTDPIKFMINKTKLDGSSNDLKLRPVRNLICNGEIYNYKDLIEQFNLNEFDLSSNCDVEIILPLYIKDYDSNISVDQCLIKALNLIDGDYSFVLTENINTYVLNSVNCFAVRDPFGVKPLYYIKNITNNIYIFISELKGLPINIIKNVSYDINYVLPGNYWSFQNTIRHSNINSTSGDFIEYYSIEHYNDLNNCIINKTDPDTLNSIYEYITTIIEDNVISRYKNSNKPLGVLLSGGLDSCIITALLVKYLVSINNDFTLNPLHIFTVGDSLGDDDLDNIYAKKLIEFLEQKYNIVLDHHMININEIEVLASDINSIIYALETYDPTTVRDSIPFFYMLKYISENTNIKALLTGDGLNQLCGYRQFKDLDNLTFQQKSVKLLKNMHKYSLLRTDRISGNFGLEIRQPFINKTFIEYMLSIHPKIKRDISYSNDDSTITKYIIRKAFENSIYGEVLLPDIHLWRRQSRISDSLTNFNLRLTKYFEENITDSMYNTNMLILNTENQNQNTLPKNKEEIYYRIFFRNNFPNRDYLVNMFWTDIWNTE